MKLTATHLLRRYRSQLTLANNYVAIATIYRTWMIATHS